jgi:diacylglycerol kinase family enzyme
MLIVNPSASSVTARSRVLINKALSADHQVTLCETTRRGHATSLARGAAAEGYDAVVVLGGDGTLNEAANGLAGSDTALATLPGGSTNVFARTLGLPDDPLDATVVILEALAERAIRRVGLGSVNGRYFLFHVGIGFDAAVVADVESRGSLKRWANHVLFGWSAFITWLYRYPRRVARFGVRVDQSPAIDDGVFAVCLNTNPYSYVGTRPFNVDTHASLDTALSVITVRTLELFPTLKLVGSALGSGEALRRSRNVTLHRDAHHIVVEGYGLFPHQVDGDYLGEVDRLEIVHEPGVLALVIPR